MIRAFWCYERCPRRRWHHTRRPLNNSFIKRRTMTGSCDERRTRLSVLSSFQDFCDGGGFLQRTFWHYKMSMQHGSHKLETFSLFRNKNALCRSDVFLFFFPVQYSFDRWWRNHRFAIFVRYLMTTRRWHEQNSLWHSGDHKQNICDDFVEIVSAVSESCD